MRRSAIAVGLVLPLSMGCASATRPSEVIQLCAEDYYCEADELGAALTVTVDVTTPGGHVASSAFHLKHCACAAIGGLHECTYADSMVPRAHANTCMGLKDSTAQGAQLEVSLTWGPPEQSYSFTQFVQFEPEQRISRADGSTVVIHINRAPAQLPASADGASRRR